MSTIEDCVEKVMAQQIEHGHSANTVQMHYYTVYSAIIKLHTEHCETSYSQDLVDTYLKSIEDRAAANEISKGSLGQRKRCIHFLTTYVNAGMVDFSFAKRKKKYVPEQLSKIVDGIKEQMTSYGLGRGTINLYYNSILAPIANLHAENNKTSYSQELVDGFLRDYEEKYNKHEITRDYYATVKRVIRYIESYTQTGTVDFSYVRPVITDHAIEIVRLVDSVLEQEKEYGHSQNTMNFNYYAIYKPIINLHLKASTPSYSQKIVDSFNQLQSDRVKNGEISQSYFQDLRRAIRLLESNAHNGTVDFSFKQRPLEIVPSEKHMKLINECIENISSGDKNSLSLFMRHFFCFIEDKNIPDDAIVTDSEIREFIITYSAKYSGSIDCIMRAVKELSSFLRKKGMLEGVTDYKVFKPKPSPLKLLPFFESSEVERMLNAIDTGTSIGLRERALILLLYGTGLRAIDIISLKRTDFDWKNANVRLVQSKTSHPIKLPLNPTTMNAVADYILEGRPDCDYPEVFLTTVKPYRPLASSSTVYATIKKLSELAGIPMIPKRGSHGFRRSRSVNLAEADVSVDMVSELEGRRNLSCENRYLTFNRKQTSFCAMDFSLVPVAASCYIATENREGGESHGVL